MDQHFRELVVYWRAAHARGERPRESKGKNVHNPFLEPFAPQDGLVSPAEVEDDSLSQTIVMAPPTARRFAR
jgi:hypothetical protein